MIFVGLIPRGANGELKFYTVKALHPKFYKTDYYCHYCYLYNFYKSPFKLSDSGPRRFPGL